MASTVDYAFKFMNFLEQVDIEINSLRAHFAKVKHILQAERNPKSTQFTTSRSVLALSQADFTQTENEFKIKCISNSQLTSY